MPAVDGFVLLAAHLGEGRFLLDRLDPSVVDESDPVATDPRLDMYDPRNGYRPMSDGPSSYAPEFLAAFRAAQRARCARLDARAIEWCEEVRWYRRRLGTAGDAPPAERTHLARHAMQRRYFLIYRTLADPRYLDPTLDPSQRPLGSIFSFGRDPVVGNYGEGLARTMSARGWLSTWSGLRSNAALERTMPGVDGPHARRLRDGRLDIYPSECRLSFERSRRVRTSNGPSSRGPATTSTRSVPRARSSRTRRIGWRTRSSCRGCASAGPPSRRHRAGLTRATTRRRRRRHRAVRVREAARHDRGRGGRGRDRAPRSTTPASRLDDVDGLCLYDIESTTVGDVAAVLGLRNVRFFSTHSHGGGAYCAVVLHAAAALTAGHASVVLTFRARNRGRRSSLRARAYTEGGRPWEKIAPRIAGILPVAGAVRRRVAGAGDGAHRAPAHARPRHHRGPPGRGRVRRSRSHAVRNPLRAHARAADAGRPSRVALRRRAAARARLLLETDGGCALVLTTARARARSAPAAGARARRRPVRGSGASPSARLVRVRPPALGDRRRRAALGHGGRRAPPTSTPRCSTTTSRRWCCVALEDWGFCGPGRAAPFVEDGAIRWPAGRLPVNTHGGQLSEAFIHGYNNLTEAVRQVRGTSTCQVPDAELVFVAAASSDPYGALLLSR